MPTEFCTYCNDVHEFRDFGLNFSGKATLVCGDRLSDVLIETMPKVHEVIEDDFIESSEGITERENFV